MPREELKEPHVLKIEIDKDITYMGKSKDVREELTKNMRPEIAKQVKLKSIQKYQLHIGKKFLKKQLSKLPIIKEENENFQYDVKEEELEEIGRLVQKMVEEKVVQPYEEKKEG